jgi:molybdate transport system regulatory protein
MNNKYFVDGHISIKSKNDSFIGAGKIELMKKIKKLGSLRKAAKEMKMSYSQAWLHVEELNRFSDKPMVILKRGGREGGIAEVTDLAEQIIRKYKELKTAFDAFLKDQSGKLNVNGKNVV